MLIRNARVVTRDEVFTGTVRIEEGLIQDLERGNTSAREAEDWNGDYLLPGLIELHTDNLEKHLAPRPGVRWDINAAFVIHDAQVAAAGITTVFDSLRIGARSDVDMHDRDLQTRCAQALAHLSERQLLRAEHFLHLRCEIAAPDVVDVGTPFAVEGATGHLWAPYKVATWSNIPSNAKDASGDWYADYGGYVAIGYNPAKVKVAPTSFASLDNPAYKNMIGLNNSPTTAGAAFAAVYAAALANGGSFGNIEPGIKYFAHLKQIGNFVPTAIGGPTTVQNGTTPILIWWDYLLASEVKPVVPGFKIIIPSDSSYASYYDQAISATAPDPAAARLWEEYLYSTTGQNLWLQGFARPIELPTLVSSGTVDKTAYAELPPAPSGALTFPSQAQQASAENVVSQNWATQVGS